MSPRSNRPDVRNPILSLPAAQELAALPPEAKAALAHVLRDIRCQAQARAQDSWRRNKGPMAAYWKAVAVYAGHTARVLR